MLYNKYAGCNLLWRNFILKWIGRNLQFFLFVARRVQFTFDYIFVTQNYPQPQFIKTGMNFIQLYLWRLDFSVSVLRVAGKYTGHIFTWPVDRYLLINDEKKKCLHDVGFEHNHLATEAYLSTIDAHQLFGSVLALYGQWENTIVSSNHSYVGYVVLFCVLSYLIPITLY